MRRHWLFASIVAVVLGVGVLAPPSAIAVEAGSRPTEVARRVAPGEPAEVVPNAVPEAAVTAVPAAPDGVVAVPGSTLANVTWVPAADGEPATSFQVAAAPVSGGATPAPVVVNAPATSAVIGGLTNGSAYRFTVAAASAGGLGARSTPSAAVTPRAWAPFGSAQALVTKAYQQLAGRAPTSAESQRDVAALTNGSKSGGDIYAALARLAYWAGVGDPVVRTYSAYFLRIPDAGGLAYWIQQRRRGMSLNQISAGFAGSGEFKKLYGSLSNREFVLLIYENVLQRAPDAGGVSYWTGQLSSGAKNRGTVMTGFSESGEYKTKMAEQVVVSMARLGLFSDAPTTAERDEWRTRLRGGATPADYYATLLALPKNLNQLAATPPSPPAFVRGVGGNRQATVTWLPPALAGSGAITGYEVTVSPGGATVNAGSAARSAVVPSLTNGTAYTFVVRAISASGRGAASAATDPVRPAGAVPGAPGTPTATAGSGQATLTWSGPTSDGGTPITGYVVTPYVGTAAQTPVTFESSATTQTVTGLTNGTSYTFRVAARNAAGVGGQSGASAPVKPVGAPGAPGTPTVTAGNGQVSLTWTAPSSDGGSPITGYVVTPFVGATAQTAVTFASTATTQVVTGLANGTEHTFKVAARNAAGTGAQSAASPTATPVGAPAAPAAPTGTAGDGQVALQWAAPTSNGGSAVTGYVITPYIGSSAQPAITVATPATSRTMTGLANGTGYTFTVAARNAVGLGAASPKSAVLTPAGTPPGAPTNVTGTPGNRSVTLTWTAPANVGSGPITGYRVTPYTGTTAQTPVTFDSPATTQVISDLTNGTAYTFAVVAIGPGGAGPASTRSAAVTPADSSTHKCGTIGTETWVSSKVYVLDCEVVVPAGATLTIQPGTVIKAEQGVKLLVQGGFVAAGTQGQPIHLTSLRDDSVGGDTNGDGASTTPSSSDWYGLIVEGNGGMTVSDLVVARAWYGIEVGRTRTQSDPAGTTLAFTRVVAPRLFVSTDYGVSVSGGRFGTQETGARGLTVAHTRSVWGPTPTLSVVGNVAIGGLEVTARSSTDGDDIAPVVKDNTAESTPGNAVVVDADVLIPTQLTGNAGTTNTADVLVLSGALGGDLTLPFAGLPVVIGRGRAWGHSGDPYSAGLGVPVGVTLTVQAGAVVKTDPIPVACGGWGCTTTIQGLHVAGSFVPRGNAGQPVVFTTLPDDTVGGDLNGDGSATSPTTGYFGGIKMATAGPVAISHLEIRHTFNMTWGGTGLTVEGTGGSVTLSDIDLGTGGGTVMVNRSRGQFGPAGDPTMSLARVTAPGITVYGDYAVSVTSSTVTALDGAATSLTVSHTRSQWGLASKVEVVDNAIAGSLLVTAVSNTNGDDVAPTVRGNTVTGSSAVAAVITADALVPSQLTGNTGTGNAANVMMLSGVLRGDLSLPMAGLTVVIGNQRSRATEPGLVTNWAGLVVPGGVKLTVAPGTTLKFERYDNSRCGLFCTPTVSGLFVSGTLQASGSTAGRVIFTSFRDDQYGGDLNGDGTSTSASWDDWGGVSVIGGSGLSLSRFTMRYVADYYYLATGLNVVLTAGSVSLDDVAIEQSGGLLSIQRSRQQGEPAGQAVSLAGVRATRAAIYTDLTLSVTGSTIGASTPVREPAFSVYHSRSQWGAAASVTVSGNTVQGGAMEVRAADGAGGDDIAPTVRNNVISRAGSVALSVTADRLVPSQLTGNTGTLNAANVLKLTGTLTGNLDLSTVTGLPIVFGQEQFDISVGGGTMYVRGVVVAAGATLTAGAGQAVKIETCSNCGSVRPAITVFGALVANGTSANRTTFTALTDDSAGGDTNGDGTATVPNVGGWHGIRFLGSGRGDLRGTTVRYAYSALESDSSGFVTFRGTIELSSSGAYACGTCAIDARNTYWGTLSGPAPFGSGPSVSGNVAVVPWVGYTGPTTSTGSVFGPAPGGGWRMGVNTSGYFADPVNTATGAFTSEVTDVAVAQTVGIPFTVTRAYTSNDTTTGPMGPGWTSTYLAKVSAAPNGDVTVRDGSGQQIVFVKQSSGGFRAEGAGRATLTQVTGGYELLHRDQTRLRFGTGGRLVWMRDRNGKGISLAYDGGGNPTSATDAAGRSYTFTTSGGLLTRVALPDGRSVSYGYTSGRLATVTDLRGGVTTYSYDTGGRLTRIVDQRGNTVALNTYGPDGRVTTQADALGRSTSFAWDPTTQIATVTDPKGGVWTDMYSGNVLVQRTDPLGRSTSYQYDTDLTLRAVTDPLGRTTRMTYDALGNVLSETDPLGATTVWTYNGLNDPTSERDANGRTTHYGYDGSGNLTSTSRPEGASTSYEMDPVALGLPATMTDGRGGVTRYSYDAAGNLTSVTTPEGARTTYGYDAMGRRTSQVDPRGNVSGATAADYRTTFTFDDGDNPTGVTSPLGHTVSTTWDAAGNKASSTNQKGRTTTFGHDAANRLVTVTAPDATVTTYGYDELGRMTSRTDAKSHTTTYGYDAVGQRVTETAPGGQVWAHSYDLAGNRVSTTQPGGLLTSWTFDGADRVREVGHSDSTPTVSFVYDAVGNRTQMSDATGVTTYSYDGLDRLIRVDQAGAAFVYGYDRNGNVTSRQYPDGAPISYAYDGDDDLTSMTDGSSVWSYDHDVAGNLTETVQPNGVEEDRTYDRSGRLVGVASTRGATTLAAASITLDAAGNPTTVVAPSGTETYEYDQLERVTRACYAGCGTSSTSYVYDAVGNRTRQTEAPGGVTTSTHDANDRLTSSTDPGGTVSYTYDAAGRQTQAGSTTMAYDATGRPTSVTTPSGTTVYTYDGDGNRALAVTGSSTSILRWDTNGPVPLLAQESDDGGTVQRRWLHGEQADAVVTDDGAVHGLHHGLVGSITAVSGPTGAREWAFSYEPFGAPRTTVQDVSPAPTVPMRFAGEMLDDTGHYNLRARLLDPTTGRFTSIDPLAAPLESPYTTTYHYAENRPGVLVDPMGLMAWWEVVSHPATELIVGSIPVVGQFYKAAKLLNTCIDTRWSCGGQAAMFGIGLGIEIATFCWSAPASTAIKFGWNVISGLYDSTGTAYAPGASGRGRTGRNSK